MFGVMKIKLIYKNHSLTQIERNIIIGSILGDGSLSLYGRSKNAYYREHSCIKQVPYRKWKAEKSSNLDFRLNERCKYPKLSSPSHLIYTDLYNKFYKDRTKILTKENIKLLDHPIGLACLYMDDGSLVISKSYKKNKIYLYPIIYIYTLNFTLSENILLKNYIKEKFDVNFNLKKRKDGQKCILQLSKRNEIMKFIDLVKPYVEEIPCMKYKVNIKERQENIKNEILKKDSNSVVILSSLYLENNYYSFDDEELIIKLKKKGLSDKAIAEELNRTYWGIVDKIRRLRKEKRL